MQIQRTGSAGLRTGQTRSAASLRKTNQALHKILERLSTARRINRASDDAAGLGVSEQLRTQVRGFKTASRNISDAMSALNIAEGASTEVSDMLQRQRELALQARNDTLTDTERQFLDQEYQQLTQEIDRIASATQFNTQEVASGEGLGSGEAQIQVGANAGETISLPAFDITLEGLGIPAGTSIATAEEAGTALSAVDTAIATLNRQRSSVGAMANRFESAQNNLSVAEINTQAAESVLRDQDIAAGIAEMTRQRLLQESATQSFGHFNEITASHILGLLQQ